QREHGQLEQRTAAEQVDEAEQRVAVADLADADLDVAVVHPGRGDERAEPEDGHDRKREQQLASQVRGPEGPDECAQHMPSWFARRRWSCGPRQPRRGPDRPRGTLTGPVGRAEGPGTWPGPVRPSVLVDGPAGGEDLLLRRRGVRVHAHLELDR